MILRELFTAHVLELLLIAISAYVAIKTYGTRESSRVTKAFSAFAIANMIFQALDLCMALNRGGVCLNGFAAGAFIYIMALTAMAGTGYHWFIYVEEAIGAKTFALKKNLYLWSIPLIVFFVLCIASVRTGWIFTFNAEGKYVVGSLFIIQYVVIFGYCLLAMVRSAFNFFVKKEKRAADRTLLVIMLVDTAAVMIQLSFMVNMMNTALVLTVLLSYLTVYSSEIERIKHSLEQERMLNQKEESERRILAENNARMLALEDSIISLYDINLDTGDYDLYVKNDAKDYGINSRLFKGSNFFEDMVKNVLTVAYPEDRDGMIKVLKADYIRGVLEKETHFDYYYRLLARGTPVWAKMRIVYKDTDKHSVIIGTFNAEEEMKSKQKDEAFKNELAQTNARLFALEDDFESLYDVELESGHYVSFVKGDFYQTNVYDKLVSPSEFFEDLRTNAAAVIYEDDRAGVHAFLNRDRISEELAKNEHVDHYYRLITDNGPTWFKLRVVYKDLDKKNIIVGVFNAKEEMAAKETEAERLLMKEHDLKHSEFRASALSHLVENEGDITSFLDFYAEKLRELVGCDQVIYRDANGAMFINNAPELGEAYQIPIEICRNCDHYDFFSPVYAKGVTEMTDTGIGVDGVSVNKDCPVKSALTRIVTLDGKANGYLAIHYLVKHHEFTDYERHTLEEFTNLLSLSLSRYAARTENAMLAKELKLKQQIEEQKEQLEKDIQMIGGLASGYDALYYVNIDEGNFSVYTTDEQKYSGTKRLLEKEINFFDLIKAYGLSEHIHPDDRHLFGDFSADTIRRKLSGSKKFSLRFRTDIGSRYRWDEMDVIKFERADEKANLLAVGFADRDAGIRSEMELQSSLNDSRIVVEALSEDFGCVNYIMLNGDKDNDTCFNFRVSDLLKKLIPGWEQEKSFSKKMELLYKNVVYEPDKEQFREDIRRERVLEALTGSDVYFVNFRSFFDGEIKYYQMKASAVRENEDITGIVVGIHSVDDSVRKEMEVQEQLEEALEAAQSANRSKSNFLFSMSHDIRTPMNAIRGFTTMAKKNVGDKEKVTAYLDKIDISGQQLLTLINQVLEMARIESGTVEFEENSVNVQEEFNSMVTVLSEQADTSGIHFSHLLKNVKHARILADEARMSSITLNIVGNALKYTPEGGSVAFELEEVRSRKAGYATYVFTVSDTGIGMSKEYLKELYHPFSRAKNSTVSKIQGTGLGLSIVKNLVDLMGGTIEVRSELGVGTRFDITVDFKIDENAENVIEESDDVTEHISFNGRRVLLVEDNEMNREIAKDILEEHGLVVEDAEDGDIAVAMVQAVVERGEFHYYDFILMDIQMPRMNGYEATKAIRAIPEPDGVHIPIIAMTANAFEEDRQNALAAGMDEHLAKPIDVQKAFRTIAKFLK